MSLDEIDRRIVEATQSGLPFVAAPYAEIASSLDLDEQEVIDRLSVMKTSGVVRRIGVAPNHYALGMTSNGMTVWDVQDTTASRLGAQVGQLDFVSHCYLRPRALPLWPYNLFAMVHGCDPQEVEEKREVISSLLGSACGPRDVLYSTRILKKTGLRLARKGTAPRRVTAKGES